MAAKCTAKSQADGAPCREKKSIQNLEEEEVELDLEEEEDLYPELERFSLSLCQHDESG